MATKPPKKRHSEDPPPLIRAIQILLALIGLVGAFLHAFPIGVHAPYEDWPNFDLTTIAWMGVVALAFWLPDISEITWGNFSVKRDKIREATELYGESLDNIANLVQNWSTSAAMFVEMMARPSSELKEPKAKIYSDYVRDRMGEAYEMLATNADETVRVGLWLYDPAKNQIVFAKGFRLNPMKDAYNLGEGMIGKAFTENRHFNEADVRNVPSYESSREGQDPPYRAVLCEPVKWGGTPIGMVTVDRTAVGHFDYLAEQVTQGLASQCALAVKVFENAEGS